MPEHIYVDGLPNFDTKHWAYVKYGGPGKVPGYVELICFNMDFVPELPCDPEIIAPGSICEVLDDGDFITLILSNAGVWYLPGDGPIDFSEPGTEMEPNGGVEH